MAGNTDGQGSNDLKVPLLTWPYLTRDMVIRSMNPRQIVDYSFSSKKAALAVKNARIHVKLMEIYLEGLDECYEDPDVEQGIELTFEGCEKSVLFWFNHHRSAAYRERGQFHEKTTIDGKVLKKCFHSDWTDDKKVGYVTGCAIWCKDMVPLLKSIENHFRSVFIIENTDLDLNGLSCNEYKKYLNVKNPKVLRKLRLNSDYEPHHAKVILGSFRPRYFHMDVTNMTFSPPPLEIVADRVRFSVKMELAHLLPVLAKEIQFSFEDVKDFKKFVHHWMTDKELVCRDKLELLKAHVPRSGDLNRLLMKYNPVRFDANRRPATYTHKMNEEDNDDEEEELNLRDALDITRDDGRVASIVCEGPKVIWFVAWPRT